MTSQATSKVRLVRCPKCRHVLRELVEVPIYRCGGCGAILQAKKRGKDLPGTESQAHEADTWHKNEVQNTLENSIAEESCLDKFPRRVDSTTDDRIEPLGEMNKSSQLYGSNAITCDHENEDSRTEARARTEEEEGRLPLYQYGAGHQDKDSGNSASKEIFQKNEVDNTSENPITEEVCMDKYSKRVDSTTDDRIESLGEIDKSSQLNSSDAITCHGIEVSSTEARECTEEEEGKLPLYQYDPADQDKDSKNSASNNTLEKKELENTSENPITEESCTGKFPKRVDSTTDDRIESLGSGYASPNYDDEGNNQHSSQVEEVDENTENLSILTSTNAETFLGTLTNDQIFTANSFSSEGISLDNLPSPHREMQHVETDMVPGLRHVGSDDTLENTSHLYAKGDWGVTLRSPTSRNYYAYEDSTSSNETENEVPDRRLQLLKRSLKDVGTNSTKVLPERSKFFMNHVTSNESELQHQLMNSESSLHGKKHSTKNLSRWHQDELLQRTTYRSPVRNRMRNETDYYNSKPLFSKYSSQADQGNSSSPNYGQNDFSALPDNPHELHRLELLRMVYELQDQLKRTQISEGMPRVRYLTRSSKGKGHQTHHFAESRENYSDLAYHNYHEKYRRDITWLKDRELSQKVVPEDPTHYMHRVDCSCFRCCNREQHHSARTPSNAIYYSEEHPMTNARQTSRPHHSASSSLRHNATSEFSLWSQDMKPDNNKHNEARIRHIAKRHFQPIAGGAPIVACYHCSETLQLPAESFLFRRRCHQLKCGACSEVLKFSLENKIHVVRYDLPPRNPPPSEIAGNTHAIKKSNLAIAHRENDRLLAEPETSTNNSQSFGRSYSTGDNFSATPGKSSSASSSTATKESIRSNSTRKSVYKIKSSAESFKSARTIMPDSEHSESEVESPLPGSTLHKLMGYSSVRRLVYQ